ncbi:hypothetical protein KM176_13005 [Pseudooceanicola sp. CBS1P-1]|uniref:Aminomethyl transferase family protein n=1 Tax=Pseudooceanicola albus TaxID=2692189 RepID=A0A6L7G469_9RHOB|nr:MULTISPECIES: aminomethyl transferase family protein [Pseudooceanicola]MBT9384781.1 hypothetical protein [Pseudooceanicola endophyticus]MXN18482.1 aminomethyl transferase family protein [Pseudooceanicola albus]
MLTAKSLETAIAEAGSAVRLLWTDAPRVWTRPVVPPEITGWREEQAAWRERVALIDLSHHMSDLFVSGKEATHFLSQYSATDFSEFAIGQAKSYIPVSEDGYLIGECIVLRTAANRYVLTGAPPIHRWLLYKSECGYYDIDMHFVDDSRRRSGPPELFRFRLQGPMAEALTRKVLGTALPELELLHSVSLPYADGEVRVLRQSKMGQPGYEFVGKWAVGERLREDLARLGRPMRLTEVGALAHAAGAVESGWMPVPVPAIYQSCLTGYRATLPAEAIREHKPIYGSFYSDRIEDYYVTPFEMGFGRVMALGRDFNGREAMLARRAQDTRRKVTLEIDAADAARVLGGPDSYLLNHGRFRIEKDGALVGLTMCTARIDPLKAVLSLSLVEGRHAAPGTELDLVWGFHPGPGTPAEADFGQQVLKARVRRSVFEAQPDMSEEAASLAEA